VTDDRDGTTAGSSSDTTTDDPPDPATDDSPDTTTDDPHSTAVADPLEGTTADPPTPTAEIPIPLVIDTDTASDDAVAVAFAALSDRVDLQAVTVVAGNAPFDAQLRNAAYTLSLVGADDVPLAAGARRPLVKSWEHATEVHGPSGFGGELDPDVTPTTTGEYGPETICRLAREHDGELGLLAIGPLTNVAEALRRDPELADNLAGVWVMGGAVHCEGNVTPAAEYNVWVDPDAAQLVTRELPVTLVDWGLTCRDGVLDTAAFDRIASFDTELASFLTAVTARAREWSRERGDGGAVGQPDCLAAAVAASPELVESSVAAHVAVDAREGVTRGHTVVDTDPDTSERINARVVTAVDAAAFRERLFGLAAEGDPDSRVGVE
jgi:purine nucleosidase